MGTPSNSPLYGEDSILAEKLVGDQLFVILLFLVVDALPIEGEMPKGQWGSSLCSLCLTSGDGYHVVHVVDRATA